VGMGVDVVTRSARLRGTVPPTRPLTAEGLTLGLLGGFSVQDKQNPDRPPAVPHHAERLLAVLAIAGVTSRAWLAGTLWAEATEERALNSLRTAIWQVNRISGSCCCGGRVTNSASPTTSGSTSGNYAEPPPRH